MPTPKVPTQAEIRATKVFDASLREQDLVSAAKGIANAKLEKKYDEIRKQFLTHSPGDERKFDKQWKNCKKMFALLIIAGVRANDIKLTLTDTNSFQFLITNPLAETKLREKDTIGIGLNEIFKGRFFKAQASEDIVMRVTDDKIARISDIINKTVVEIGNDSFTRKALHTANIAQGILPETLQEQSTREAAEAKAIKEEAEREAKAREEAEREAKTREEGRQNFIKSATNLIGDNSNAEYVGGFIHKADEVARVQRVIGYFEKNTSLDDPAKMHDVIWVASQINLVRDLRAPGQQSAPSEQDPMQNCTDFVVRLVSTSKLRKNSILGMIGSIPKGTENNILHNKLTAVAEEHRDTIEPKPTPCTSIEPTSCFSFLDIIAKKFTNLVDRIFGNSSERSSGSRTTHDQETGKPSAICTPKGFVQLAGEMLKSIGKSIIG